MSTRSIAVLTLFSALSIAALAATEYGKTVFYDDVSIGTYPAPSNITAVLKSGGAHTNPETLYYRVSGFNRKGRIPASTNIPVQFPGGSTASVMLAWTRYDGIQSNVVELSQDGGTYTQWVAVSATRTNWTDSGTSVWTCAAFSDAFAEIAPPSVPWLSVDTNGLAAQGNEAFGWGNHADAGYMLAAASNDLAAQGNEAFGWGNHADAGYMPAAASNDLAAQGNVAFGWGNHADAGYMPTNAPGVPVSVGSAHVFGDSMNSCYGGPTLYLEGRVETIPGTTMFDAAVSGFGSTPSLAWFVDSQTLGYFYGSNLIIRANDYEVADGNGGWTPLPKIGDSYLAASNVVQEYSAPIDANLYGQSGGAWAAIDTNGLAAQGNEAFAWGDHATNGYLTTYTETDPLAIHTNAAGGIDTRALQIAASLILTNFPVWGGNYRDANGTYYYAGEYQSWAAYTCPSNDMWIYRGTDDKYSLAETLGAPDNTRYDYANWTSTLIGDWGHGCGTIIAGQFGELGEDFQPRRHTMAADTSGEPSWDGQTILRERGGWFHHTNAIPAVFDAGICVGVDALHIGTFVSNIVAAATAGLIPEAPIDGQAWYRFNGAWAALPTWVTNTPPADDVVRGLSNGAWIAVQGL